MVPMALATASRSASGDFAPLSIIVVSFALSDAENANSCDKTQPYPEQTRTGFVSLAAAKDDVLDDPLDVQPAKAHSNGMITDIV